jgi:hypothetical protein
MNLGLPFMVFEFCAFSSVHSWASHFLFLSIHSSFLYEATNNNVYIIIYWAQNSDTVYIAWCIVRMLIIQSHLKIRFWGFSMQLWWSAILGSDPFSSFSFVQLFILWREMLICCSDSLRITYSLLMMEGTLQLLLEDQVLSCLFQRSCPVSTQMPGVECGNHSAILKLTILLSLLYPHLDLFSLCSWDYTLHPQSHFFPPGVEKNNLKLSLPCLFSSQSIVWENPITSPHHLSFFFSLQSIKKTNSSNNNNKLLLFLSLYNLNINLNSSGNR